MSAFHQEADSRPVWTPDTACHPIATTVLVDREDWQSVVKTSLIAVFPDETVSDSGGRMDVIMKLANMAVVSVGRGDQR